MRDSDSEPIMINMILQLVGGYFDNRMVIGGDFSGNLFDAGLYGEGIISSDYNNFQNNFTKFVLGLDNQFSASIYALIEYQFNGQGSSDKNNYNVVGLLNGQIINLSQNYIFVSASYILTPLLTLTVSDNIGLNDNSGFFILTGVYSLTENSTLTIGSLIPYGISLSEYSYYPSSVYMQASCFFNKT